jgi:hypothetical protein
LLLRALINQDMYLASAILLIYCLDLGGGSEAGRQAREAIAVRGEPLRAASRALQ